MVELFAVELFFTAKKEGVMLRILGVILVLLLCSFPASSGETWEGLVVAPEERCSDYSSRQYGYPRSVEPRIVESMDGRVYGPYTGSCFESIRQTDIEHIVARSEAHDSGLCAADLATKKAFASDLLNLTLASPSVNRDQKVAKDAADWLPDLNKCWYADRVVQVRRKYGLTIDRREMNALKTVLAACASTAMVFSDCAVLPGE